MVFARGKIKTRFVELWTLDRWVASMDARGEMMARVSSRRQDRP